ncbi:hypothetical protein BpHYR1_046350 [Brachionus plicatilis]|uniref:Uncharacterized protein n=1 Tax=Brachionus plicatilis TaxID=10195 RepID=A0A3M7R135_BRAPC|nr:hypothetical protein BpHYR1_046350 [Brachionus plicatilis]
MKIKIIVDLYLKFHGAHESQKIINQNYTAKVGDDLIGELIKKSISMSIARSLVFEKFTYFSSKKKISELLFTN